MDEFIRRRCVETGQWMLARRATVRQTAAHFGLSKSSVHKDLCTRLPRISPSLAQEVASLMRYNRSVRHLRGGEATRLRHRAKKCLSPQEGCGILKT